MPTIGYGYQIIRPEFEGDVQNTELIAKVLMSKQKEFDTAYAGAKELQRQALGINFINKIEQGKIDVFNAEINKVFATGEFGDLSDSKNAEKYYSLFDDIGQDKVLVSKYRQDKSYQDQVRNVEMKRQAKDPAKAGFGDINYDNFMSDVRDYSLMNLDAPDSKGYVLPAYTDYVDIHKELAERMKLVPIKKFSEARFDNGRIVTDFYEGRDPEATKASIQEYMKSRGAAQIREQAKYTMRKAKGDPNFQAAIYQDHVDYNTSAQASIRGELDKIQEEMPKLTDVNKIKEYATRQANLESSLAELEMDIKTPDDYFSRDADEIVNDISKIALQDVIQNGAQSYGGFAKSTKVEPDRAWLEVEKMKQRAAEFRIVEERKNREFAASYALDQAKAAKEGKTPSSTTPSNAATAAAAGMSYVSASDPTHIDFGSTIKDIEGTLTKLYAQKTNFLESGLPYGDNKLSAEAAGLELLINDKSLDANPYYNESPYLRAWKVAKDELYTQNPALAEYIGKRPQDNYSWDRLKEANNIVKSRVNQIMNSPKTREEAKYANHLQDVNANALSLQEFMTEANAQGNPAAYIKNKQNIKIYSNMVYDFDVPKDADKDQKAAVANMEQLFRPSFENYLDVPAAEYNATSTSLSSGEWNKQFIDPSRARTVPYGQVRKVETGPDGTLKVYFKPDAFKAVSTNETYDPVKSGVLAREDSYYMVKMGNGYVKQTRQQIESRGFLEMKDPNFSRLNWSNQLGITVGAKPQKRWDFSADGQSVPFEVRRNTNDNTVQLSVMGGTWQPMKTSDVSQAITIARNQIATHTVAEITGQPETPQQ